MNGACAGGGPEQGEEEVRKNVLAAIKHAVICCCDLQILRDPVVVLDRNSESYINLKYPILPGEPTAIKAVTITEEEQFQQHGNQAKTINKQLQS